MEVCSGSYVVEIRVDSDMDDWYRSDINEVVWLE